VQTDFGIDALVCGGRKFASGEIMFLACGYRIRLPGLRKGVSGMGMRLSRQQRRSASCTADRSVRVGGEPSGLTNVKGEDSMSSGMKIRHRLSF
jgi:hypothetical protein